MEWTQELAVGVETIDSQHRELFSRINKLVRAIKEHRCKDEIDGTIAFLEEYARTHFSMEEQLMKDASYEGLASHQGHHAQYMANLAELKQEASLPRVSGMSYDLSVTANQIVVDWIVDHIMKIDRKFGEFLRQRK
jgi:hemerythrin-like metal-binding protein